MRLDHLLSRELTLSALSFELIAVSQAYQVDPAEALDLVPLLSKTPTRTSAKQKNTLLHSPLASGAAVVHQRSDRTRRTAFVCPNTQFPRRGPIGGDNVDHFPGGVPLGG